MDLVVSIIPTQSSDSDPITYKNSRIGSADLVLKHLLLHQEFQVPKVEGFLNLIAGYFGGGENPLHKPYPYSLYR